MVSVCNLNTSILVFSENLISASGGAGNAKQDYADNNKEANNKTFKNKTGFDHYPTEEDMK